MYFNFFKKVPFCVSPITWGGSRCQILYDCSYKRLWPVWEQNQGLCKAVHVLFSWAFSTKAIVLMSFPIFYVWVVWPTTLLFLLLSKMSSLIKFSLNCSIVWGTSGLPLCDYLKTVTFQHPELLAQILCFCHWAGRVWWEWLPCLRRGEKERLPITALL